MADTALAKKLQIKPGTKAAIINAQTGYAEKLGLESNSVLSTKSTATIDFILAFATRIEELGNLVADIRPALKSDGILWIAYPKGGSTIKTDLNRDVLRGEVMKLGLVGVSLVAIDDTWSAMRFRPTEKVGK